MLNLLPPILPLFILSLPLYPSSLAKPLGPPSLANLLLSQYSNGSLTALSPLLRYNLTTTTLPLSLNTTAIQPSNLSATAFNSPTSGPGWDWKVHVTEGLLKVQAEEAEEAYLWTVSSIFKTIREDPEAVTTNVADLRRFSISCYDPHAREFPGPYIWTVGSVNPATGKASWSTPERTESSDPQGPIKLDWPPDHDPAEAAAELGEPFSGIDLWPNVVNEHLVYHIIKGLDVLGEVDANTLEVL